MPPDDERSNYRSPGGRCSTGSSELPDVHRIRGELPPAEAAAEYDARARRRRRSTCSCSASARTRTSPRSSRARRSSPSASGCVDERASRARAVRRPRDLTLPTLLSAGGRSFLVAGADKAEAVDARLRGTDRRGRRRRASSARAGHSIASTSTSTRRPRCQGRSAERRRLVPRDRGVAASRSSTSTVSATGTSSRYSSRVSNETRTDSTRRVTRRRSPPAIAASASATSGGKSSATRVAASSAASPQPLEREQRERRGVAPDRRLGLDRSELERPARVSGRRFVAARRSASALIAPIGRPHDVGVACSQLSRQRARRAVEPLGRLLVPPEHEQREPGPVGRVARSARAAPDRDRASRPRIALRSRSKSSSQSTGAFYTYRVGMRRSSARARCSSSAFSRAAGATAPRRRTTTAAAASKTTVWLCFPGRNARPVQRRASRPPSSAPNGSKTDRAARPGRRARRSTASTSIRPSATSRPATPTCSDRPRADPRRRRRRRRRSRRSARSTRRSTGRSRTAASSRRRSTRSPSSPTATSSPPGATTSRTGTTAAASC